MKVTIKDVAREAGVSISTVTYALKKKGKATKESHKRVLDAVEKLNYVPDATARSLVSGRTNSIGLFVPPIPNMNFSQPFLLQVFSALSVILAEKGYWLSICMPPAKDSHTLRSFIANARVDGLIWLIDPIPAEVLSLLDSRHIPHISMEFGSHSTGNYSTILFDDYKGIDMLVEYLYCLHHRRILFLKGEAGKQSDSSRARAYMERMNALNTGYMRILEGNYTEKLAYQNMRAFLAEESELPTAVIAANDPMAFGVIRAIRDAGLRVPQDISVTGFDDIPTAVEFDPALTTVRQPVISMMRSACDYLMNCIDHGTAQKSKTLIMPELVVRSSVQGL